MLGALKKLLDRRAKPLSRRTQLIVTLVTSIALAGFTVWAWRTANVSLGDLNPVALVVIFCAISPLTMWLKMLEYDAAARLVGTRTTYRTAFEVGVVSAAANLLPLPGSLLVTTRALSEGGATYGSAALASSIPGITWLGLAGLVGGPAIMIAGGVIAGAVVFAGACAVMALATVLFLRSAPREGRGRLAIRLLLIEGSWIVASGFRFWMLFIALGVSATPAQAMALAVAGAMAVAMSIFPAGLGVREALIALLSPIIDLSVSRTFVLGILDRVLWLTFLSLMAVVMVVMRGRARAAIPTTDAATAEPPPLIVPGEAARP